MPWDDSARSPLGHGIGIRQISVMHILSDALARAEAALVRPRESRARSLGPRLVLAAVCVFVVRGTVRWSGWPFVGDWVPVGSAYAGQAASPWNLLQHNGTFNPDLRLVWLFEPLGHLAGTPGSWTFSLFNSLFLAVVALFPVIAAYRTFARAAPGRSVLQVVLALFYGFNPWVTAQDASGHVGVVVGYGLLVFVVFPSAGSGTAKAVRLGLLVALTFALDPHMGVVAASCALSTMIVRRLRVPVTDAVENQISTLRELLVAALTAVACSVYWIVPDLLITSRLPFVPVAVPEPISTISSLARLDDLFHLAGLRSFWWRAFSDGFYAHGLPGDVVAAALVAGPLGLLVTAVIRRPVRRLSALPALWAAVPLILTQWAHHSAATYGTLVSLPGGALLRDPNVTLPFAVLALCALACVADPLRHGARSTVLLAVTAASSLVPWFSGTLNGYLAPLRSVGSQATAVSWLNAHAGSRSLTLWLPADAYIKTDWSSGLVTDPVRFWTTVPVVNPLLDPAYDFAPTATLATESIVSMIADGRERDKLGRMLAAAGVRYVVVRRDAQPHSVTLRYAQTLRQARGVRLVRRFGKEDVFAMPGPAPARATIPAGVTLFGGTWDDLAQSLEIDPRHDRTYVDLQGVAAAAPKLMEDRRTTILTDHMQAAALAIGRSSTVPDARARERLTVGHEIMYLYKPGEGISLASEGLFAAHVLGLNEDIAALCEGRLIATPEIYEQPDVRADRYSARWIGLECGGTASLHFRGRVWVGSVQTVATHVFERRLAAVRQLVAHPGSAYMLHADRFADVAGAVALSRSEDLLYLPPGPYRLRLACKSTCPPARIRVVTAAGGLRPVSKRLPAGSRFSIVSQPPDAPLRNEYRVEIGGPATTVFANVYVERVSAAHPRGSRSAGTARASADSVTFAASGRRAVLTLAGSPAPWLMSGDAKTLYGPLIADMYGNVLGVTGGSGKLSLGYLRRAQLAASAVSAAFVLGLLGYLVLRPHDRRRRGRRAASTTGRLSPAPSARPAGHRRGPRSRGQGHRGTRSPGGPPA
jgi:hypothetical protein